MKKDNKVALKTEIIHSLTEGDTKGRCPAYLNLYFYAIKPNDFKVGVKEFFYYLGIDFKDGFDSYDDFVSYLRDLLIDTYSVNELRCNDDVLLCVYKDTEDIRKQLYDIFVESYSDCLEDEDLMSCKSKLSQ